MFFYLIQGVILALSATIMPGPFQAFLLSYAIRNGWKRTLPAALAPVVTDGPILALFLFLLTHVPLWCLDGLRIAGGLFILYLAKGIFHAFRQGGPAFMPENSAAHKSFFSAIGINVLNPNPYIFWSGVGGPIVLSGWRQSPVLGVSFLVGFFGTFVLGLSLLIIVFASAGRLDPRVTRVLSGIAFVALAAFGLYQIGSGVAVLLMTLPR